MKTIIYLLQVAACTGIFYGFYFLLLRRLTFFTINRWYLLATLLLSFVIPTINLPLDTAKPPAIMEPVMYVNRIQVIDEPVKAITQAPQQVVESFDWATQVKMIYITMATISVLHLAFTLLVFLRRSRAERLMQIGNVKVLKGNSKQGNSSFLNVIFVNDDELEPAEVKQIIAHEMLHVKMLHSADRIIARLVQIMLWFNPFAYCYIRSIEENHEFEVDRIIAGDTDKSMYATLLFKLSLSSQSYLMHSFSKVPLKSRIAMLFNKPTSNMKKIIYLLIAPVVLISCLAFANLKSAQNQKVSIFHDLDKMGPHPLVLINGKEYNDDILYKIGSKNISTTGTWVPPVDGSWFKKYGNKAKDGVVNISVKGEIVYLTATERDNLIEESKVPKKQFFARVKQKHNDGSIYEKCIVQLPNGSRMISNELKPTDKVIFIIEGKAYPETELDKVEEIIRSNKVGTTSVGSVNHNQHWGDEDISQYKIYFNFLLDRNAKLEKTNSTGVLKYEVKGDTIKYRQKVKQTPEQRIAEEKVKAEYEAYKKTDEFKQKMAETNRIMGQTLTYKVTGYKTAGPQWYVKEGFVVLNNNSEFFIGTAYGQTKQLKDVLKIGDEVEIKVLGAGMWGKGIPVLIEPAVISRDGKEIYRAAEAAPIPKTAFSFEANRVRFTDGQVTNIKKYPNGKWKSAVVEVVNGFKIKFNIKPDAPDFKGIEWGDNVTFRFVHEVKTGAKEYTVNDWIAISTDVKDYGIKNPDYFFKFYEKI
ncbi:hypothetical protein IDJ75_05895 [Mucilaginibacter rigui]|uniref:Peptidase M56 domain-containing protein n=1 Tax=Mucilaginibacter rigui TaxID=534635 RepID=A0ABR7X2H9_9SPHI|nr:M56 family metallopeptidase [Mucilaginibacter rigui]MBD1384802.1 hypothetical protein [Mucilaginibacter rigui]